MNVNVHRKYNSDFIDIFEKNSPSLLKRGGWGESLLSMQKDVVCSLSLVLFGKCEVGQRGRVMGGLEFIVIFLKESENII
jgi:hypothetical protein